MNKVPVRGGYNTLDEKPIPQRETAKCLDMIQNERLNWTVQVNEVCAKSW